MCSILFDLCRYNDDSTTLAEALIEGLETPELMDYIKPLNDDGACVRDHNVGYRVVSFLIEQGKEKAAAKVAFHFHLDVNYEYSARHKDAGLCLMTHALRYNRQWFLEAIVLYDYFDPYEWDEVKRLYHRTRTHFDSIAPNQLANISNSEMSERYEMAKSVSRFLLNHCCSDARKLKDTAALFMPVLSEDAASLVPFLNKGLLLSDISEPILSKTTKGTCTRLMHIRFNESRLSDRYKERLDVPRYMKGDLKKDRRRINNNDVRKLIPMVRENRIMEKELLRSVEELGNSDALIKCWQKSLYDIMRSKGHGFYVNESFTHLLRDFCGLLDKPVVPGLKKSPIANMEWFEEKYLIPIVSKGIDLAYMVDSIRTPKQLSMVCKAYEVSPSTLLIMHGDKLKPSMRKSCVDKLA